MAAHESYDWALMRAHFATAAVLAEQAAVPEVTAEDVPLADWHARRTELGLGSYDSDFIGIDGDQAGGLPDWRHPDHIEPKPTAMDEYAETRQASGVRSASDFFGVAPRQARVNSSPWSI